MLGVLTAAYFGVLLSSAKQVSDCCIVAHVLARDCCNAWIVVSLVAKLADYPASVCTCTLLVDAHCLWLTCGKYTACTRLYKHFIYGAGGHGWVLSLICQWYLGCACRVMWLLREAFQEC